jgi:hypothetical protein
MVSPASRRNRILVSKACFWLTDGKVFSFDFCSTLGIVLHQVCPSLLAYSLFIHFCRLDALEAAEEAHIEFLRSIAQKEAPDPIGAASAAAAVSMSAAAMSAAANGQAATDGSAVDATTTTTATTARTRFWIHARTQSDATAGTAATSAGAGSNPGEGRPSVHD